MQLEETIEIFAYEDEGLRKLRISVLSSLDIFEIESDDDVIQHFEGINIIQHQNPTTLTVSKLMGKILSSNDGSLSICGQTIPLSLLDLLCRESLKVASLDTFFQVCHCVIPGFVYTCQRRKEWNPSIPSKYNLTARSRVDVILSKLREKIMMMRSRTKRGKQSAYALTESLKRMWLAEVDMLGLSIQDSYILRIYDRIQALAQSRFETTEDEIREDAQLLLDAHCCLTTLLQDDISTTDMEIPLIVHNKKPSSHFKLSASNIWALLILSEALGAFVVLSQTISRLHKLLCPSECICSECANDTRGEVQRGSGAIPLCAISTLPAEYIPILTVNLRKYFASRQSSQDQFSGQRTDHNSDTIYRAQAGNVPTDENGSIIHSTGFVRDPTAHSQWVTVTDTPGRDDYNVYYGAMVRREHGREETGDEQPNSGADVHSEEDSVVTLDDDSCERPQPLPTFLQSSSPQSRLRPRRVGPDSANIDGGSASNSSSANANRRDVWERQARRNSSQQVSATSRAPSNGSHYYDSVSSLESDPGEHPKSASGRRTVEQRNEVDFESPLLSSHRQLVPHSSLDRFSQYNPSCREGDDDDDDNDDDSATELDDEYSTWSEFRDDSDENASTTSTAPAPPFDDHHLGNANNSINATSQSLGRNFTSNSRSNRTININSTSIRSNDRVKHVSSYGEEIVASDISPSAARAIYSTYPDSVAVQPTYRAASFDTKVIATPPPPPLPPNFSISSSPRSDGSSSGRTTGSGTGSGSSSGTSSGTSRGTGSGKGSDPSLGDTGASHRRHSVRDDEHIRSTPLSLQAKKNQAAMKESLRKSRLRTVELQAAMARLGYGRGGHKPSSPTRPSSPSDTGMGKSIKINSLDMTNDAGMTSSLMTGYVKSNNVNGGSSNVSSGVISRSFSPDKVSMPSNRLPSTPASPLSPPASVVTVTGGGSGRPVKSAPLGVAASGRTFTPSRQNHTARDAHRSLDTVAVPASSATTPAFGSHPHPRFVTVTPSTSTRNQQLRRSESRLSTDDGGEWDNTPTRPDAVPEDTLSPEMARLRAVERIRLKRLADEKLNAIARQRKDKLDQTSHWDRQQRIATLVRRQSDGRESNAPTTVAAPQTTTAITRQGDRCAQVSNIPTPYNSRADPNQTIFRASPQSSALSRPHQPAQIHIASPEVEAPPPPPPPPPPPTPPPPAKGILKSTITQSYSSDRDSQDRRRSPSRQAIFSRMQKFGENTETTQAIYSTRRHPSPSPDTPTLSLPTNDSFPSSREALSVSGALSPLSPVAYPPRRSPARLPQRLGVSENHTIRTAPVTASASMRYEGHSRSHSASNARPTREWGAAVDSIPAHILATTPHQLPFDGAAAFSRAALAAVGLDDTGDDDDAVNDYYNDADADTDVKVYQNRGEIEREAEAAGSAGAISHERHRISPPGALKNNHLPYSTAADNRTRLQAQQTTHEKKHAYSVPRTQSTSDNSQLLLGTKSNDARRTSEVLGQATEVEDLIDLVLAGSPTRVNGAAVATNRHPQTDLNTTQPKPVSRPVASRNEALSRPRISESYPGQPTATKNLRSEVDPLHSPLNHQGTAPCRENGTLPYAATVLVKRAWNLPDSAGGSNPYIHIDWGHLGSATTPTIERSTSPLFEAKLRFRCPLQAAPPAHSVRAAAMLSVEESIVSNVEYRLCVEGRDYCADFVPPFRIMAYSRNHSVSDELLGEAVIDVRPLVREAAETLGSATHFVKVELLTDGGQVTAGVVEISMLLSHINF